MHNWLHLGHLYYKKQRIKKLRQSAFKEINAGLEDKYELFLLDDW